MRFVRALAFVFASLVVSPSSAQDVMRLAGSNTVGAKLAPNLVREWAKARGYSLLASTEHAAEERTLEFATPAGRLRVDVRSHGTSTGYAALVEGEADLWMASRPASADEVGRALPQIGPLDAPSQEHVLALDGLAVIVHPDQRLREISLGQLREVFAGRIRDWSALGGRAGPIRVLARDDRSGTYDTFKSLVLRDAVLVPRATRFESNDRLADAVAADPGAIGFVGVASIGPARALAVRDENTRALAPDALNVATEDYVLSRRLFLYHGREPSPIVRDFVGFALDAQGQSVVATTGFIAQQVAALPVQPPSDAPAEYQQLVRDARRVTLNLRFGTGRSYLDSRATRDLDRLVAWMRGQSQRYELAVIGFTDGLETHPVQAISLSNERVDFIADQLARRGHGPRIARGLGDIVPVASDQTEAGRSKNRRVEVWVRPVSRSGTTGARAGSP